MYGHGARNPAANMIGITHHVSNAPPVRYQSVRFIAISIAIIEIMLMPIAVLKALNKIIPPRNINTVSNNMLVIRPLIIASIMMATVGQGIPVTWKKAIVPKSPIEHPTRHQSVLFALLRQV